MIKRMTSEQARRARYVVLLALGVAALAFAFGYYMGLQDASCLGQGLQEQAKLVASSPFALFSATQLRQGAGFLPLASFPSALCQGFFPAPFLATYYAGLLAEGHQLSRLGRLSPPKQAIKKIYHGLERCGKQSALPASCLLEIDSGLASTISAYCKYRSTVRPETPNSSPIKSLVVPSSWTLCPACSLILSPHAFL